MAAEDPGTVKALTKRQMPSDGARPTPEHALWFNGKGRA
jgi:hypothetical protein